MSVFIEGLSADYVLDHCNRTIDSDGISYVTVHMVLNEVEVEKIRIKKISTPHGRLIDADKYMWSGDLIDEPTIVEAEE